MVLGGSVVDGLADVKRATEEDCATIDVASEVGDVSLELSCSVVEGICEVSPVAGTKEEDADIVERRSEYGSVVVSALSIVDDGVAELITGVIVDEGAAELSVELAITEEEAAELISAAL